MVNFHTGVGHLMNKILKEDSGYSVDSIIYNLQVNQCAEIPLPTMDLLFSNSSQRWQSYYVSVDNLVSMDLVIIFFVKYYAKEINWDKMF